MRNLGQKNSLLLLLVLLFAVNSNAQFPAKFYKNRMMSRNYSTTKGIHARALLVNDDRLIIGTNEGLIFSCDKNFNEFEQWQHAGYREIRDLAIVNGQVVAMASGDTSALIFYDAFSKIDTIIPFNGVFLDGMDVYNDSLFLMGDPVDGYFSLYLYSTEAGLESMKNVPKAKKGEAAFAASGSTVHFTTNGDKVFVTGGGASRVFIQYRNHSDWVYYNIPIDAEPTSGPYSIYLDESRWIVVGGDYFSPNMSDQTGFYSDDFGQTWKVCKKNPSGYRSCIMKFADQYYACGTNGLDVSKNGKRWKKMSYVRFFAMVPFDEYLIYSGENGVIHRSNNLSR